MEVLEPFTHLGRIVRRYYTDGFIREYQYLFTIDYDNPYQKEKGSVFDVYDKESGRFVYTYRKAETIGKEYGVASQTVDAWIRGDQESRVPIIVKKRELC